jgi:adenosylcobinamide-phosphate synthase
LTALCPNPYYLLAAVALDLLLGDPQYRLHPIRLIGASIVAVESRLRAWKLDGVAGGVVLGIALAVFWTLLTAALLFAAARLHPWATVAAHVFIVYSLLALRNLLDHVWAVEAAARRGDLDGARAATAMFVARDTRSLDIAACRRAGLESLSENLTDGYVSPLLWYTVAGIPGIVVFKVFSTLDSMVGNKSERYLYFGRFSARVDDVLNWIPARLTWALIAVVAAFIKKCSAADALRVGWHQHAWVPGPNSGWSEAATAGALRLRLVGPIILNGQLVTDVWLGDASWPEAGTDREDVTRGIVLTTLVGLTATGLCIAWLLHAA